MKLFSRYPAARAAFVVTAFASVFPLTAAGQEEVRAKDPGDFPVTPIPFVEGAFNRCEGIAFNGEGRLFVAGDRALWEVNTEGSVTRLVGLYSNLGLAPIGERDILMADFGPNNAFDGNPVRDGIVWRITPEGDTTRVVNGGIGDPNFILVLPDRSFLVSDDAKDEIFRAELDGSIELYTRAVAHPNGMALEDDGDVLYIAQSFQQIHPFVLDDRLWAMPLADGMPAGEPEVVARLGEQALNDGLALDAEGRVYVAVNVQGTIWRYDPGTGETVLVAEGLPGAGSLAFGRGAFDTKSLYVTSTRTGNVWVVPVGAQGALLNR
jgi:sugar lactone lactonase YvrE